MRLSHFNSKQHQIRDMFVTAITAMVNSKIPTDSGIASCSQDVVYAMIISWDSSLFYYHSDQLHPNKVAAIKSMRELAGCYSEQIVFPCYSAELTAAFSGNVRGVTTEYTGSHHVITWHNKMTLKEAKDIVDSYYSAISSYADSANKLSSD